MNQVVFRYLYDLIYRDKDCGKESELIERAFRRILNQERYETGIG